MGIRIDIQQVKAAIAKSSRPEPPACATTRDAAVFVLFVQREGTNLLYIRRADRGDPWSGQIAFPGGHVDGDDPSSLAAAYRETEEEIGIPQSSIAFVGELGVFPTQFEDVRVRVFVGEWSGRDMLRPDPREVAEVFETPVRDLLDIEQRGEFDNIATNELRRRLIYPVYAGEVWGVTARITHYLLGLIRRSL